MTSTGGGGAYVDPIDDVIARWLLEPVASSPFVHYVVVICMSELSLSVVRRSIVDRYQTYVLHATTTFFLLTCSVAHPFVRCRYGEWVYLVTTFLIATWCFSYVSRAGGSCPNPCQLVAKYMTGLLTSLDVLALFLAQFIGAALSYQVDGTVTSWLQTSNGSRSHLQRQLHLDDVDDVSASVTSSGGEQRVGNGDAWNDQRLADNATASASESHFQSKPLLALSVEVGGTLLVFLMARMRLTDFSAERYIRAFLLSTVSVIGTRYTGYFLNPLAALKHAAGKAVWRNRSTGYVSPSPDQFIEHLAIYWFGPLCGTVLGVHLIDARQPAAAAAPFDGMRSTSSSADPAFRSDDPGAAVHHVADAASLEHFHQQQVRQLRRRCRFPRTNVERLDRPGHVDDECTIGTCTSACAASPETAEADWPPSSSRTRQPMTERSHQQQPGTEKWSSRPCPPRFPVEHPAAAVDEPPRRRMAAG